MVQAVVALLDLVEKQVIRMMMKHLLLRQSIAVRERTANRLTQRR